MQVLSFYLQNVLAAMNLSHIEKVIPLIMIESIPQAPFYVIGIINLSGESILVIDLALYLGLPRPPKYALSSSIIICNDKKHQIGVLVDQVIGLAELNADEIQMQNEFKNDQLPFLGSVKIKEKLALLLHPTRVVEIGLNESIEKIRVNKEIVSKEVEMP